MEFFLHWSPVAYWAPTDIKKKKNDEKKMAKISITKRVLLEKINKIDKS